MSKEIILFILSIFLFPRLTSHRRYSEALCEGVRFTTHG